MLFSLVYFIVGCILRTGRYSREGRRSSSWCFATR